MLRTAVIGMGWAGTRHVEAIRELGRKVTVSCLVDNDEAHLRQKSAQMGVSTTYQDWADALRDKAVDAVSICLPHALHCEVAVKAAEAGKHVICEKPIAMTVDEASRMIEAADSNGVTLFVAENVCYSPMSVVLRKIVRSGRYVGEVVSASFARGFRGVPYGYPGRRSWLSTPQAGGSGHWLLNGIHSVAQIRFIFGEVDSVFMQSTRAASFGRSDVEGTVSGTFVMAAGHPLSVLQTAEVRLKDTLAGCVIHGDGGSVRAGNDRYEVFRGDGTTEVLAYPEETLSSYAAEFEAFADTVAGESEGPTTGVSERRSLAVVQAGYESADSGQVVDIRERFGEL